MKAVIVCGLAATASAAPIGEAWRQPQVCGASLAVGETTFATIDHEGGLHRRNLANGDGEVVWKLPHAAKVSIDHIEDNLLVVRDPYGFNAYDGTGKLLFHRIIKNPHKNAAQFALGVGGGRIAYSTWAGNAHRVEIDDLKGNKVVDIPMKNAVEHVTLGKAVFVDELGREQSSSLVAYGFDGKELHRWTGARREMIDSVVSDGDQVVVATTEKTYLLDANLAQVWSYDRILLHVAAVTADRVYLTNHGTGLFAIDRKTGKLVWEMKRRGPEATAVLAASGSIYTVDDDRLTELDATTGKVINTLGVGGMTLAGSSTFVACDGQHLIGYTPGANDLPTEKATIKGKLKNKCPACNLEMWVMVNGVVGKVGKDGRFSVTFTGRGTYTPYGMFSDSSDVGWNDSQDLAPVTLTGKGTYDLGTTTIDAPSEEGG